MLQFKIGDKFTAMDWGLLLSSYEIGEPKIKTNYIELPVGDGSIDLTEALRGDVSYSNREITAKFTTIAPRDTWRALMDTIKAYCHGRKVTIVAPEDDEYYYIGRINVGPLVKSASSAEFTLTITADPYKYKNSETVVNLTVGATGTLAVTLTNGRRSAIPTMTTNAATQVVKPGVSSSFNAGTHKLVNFILKEGNNPFTFNAVNGTAITITYQEGTL